MRATACAPDFTDRACFRASCRLASATFQPLPERLESKWLAKITLSYIQRHHDAFNALFDLMAVFSGPMGEYLTAADVWCADCPCPESTRRPPTAAVDFTFLKTFVTDTVAKHFTADEKRMVCGKGVTESVSSTGIVLLVYGPL